MRTIIEALESEALASEEIDATDSSVVVMRVAAQNFQRVGRVLEAAEKALRSYQYGNSAPALAEQVADACAAELALLQEDVP